MTAPWAVAPCQPSRINPTHRTIAHDSPQPLASLAGALSPYLIGWQIERQLNAQDLPLQASSARAPALQIQTLQRGWLTTQASSTLALPGTRLELQHNIEHGPLSLNWRQPALAALHTVLPGPQCRRIGIDCAQTSPVLDSLLQWDGSSLHRLNIPYMRTAQFSLLNIDSSLRLPAFSQSRQAGAQAAMPAAIEFSLQADQVQTMMFELNALRAALQAKPMANLLILQSQLSADAFIWQQHNWGDLHLELHAEPLDTALLLQLLQQQQAVDQLLALQNWLALQPIFRLEQLSLDQARLTAQGKVRLRPVELWQLLRRPSLQTLFSALLESAELNLRIAPELAAQLLAFWHSGELSTQAMTHARQQLQAWSQAGFINLRDNYLHSHLVFKDNQLSGQVPARLPDQSMPTHE